MNLLVSEMDKLIRCREETNQFKWYKNRSFGSDLKNVLRFDTQLGCVDLEESIQGLDIESLCILTDTFLSVSIALNVGGFMEEQDCNSSNAFYYRILLGHFKL